MRTATTFVALLSVAATLALTGCGSTSPSEQVAAETATATVTATVTETAAPATVAATPKPKAREPHLTKQEAGQVYLKAVKPWNRTVGILDEEIESPSPSLDRLIKLAGDMVDHNRAWMETLDNNRWPKGIQSDVDELYRELSTFHGLFESMSNRAESVDEFYNIYMVAVDKSHTGTSQRIRIALGIER